MGGGLTAAECWCEETKEKKKKKRKTTKGKEKTNTKWSEQIVPSALEMCHGSDRVDNYSKDKDQKENQKETENETERNNPITV